MKLHLISLIAFALLFLPSCRSQDQPKLDDTEELKSISFTESSLDSIFVGETRKIELRLIPSDFPIEAIKLSTDSFHVVKLSSDSRTLTAIREGVALLTAEYKNVKTTAEIKVRKREIHFENKTLTMMVGAKFYPNFSSPPPPLSEYNNWITIDNPNKLILTSFDPIEFTALKEGRVKLTFDNNAIYGEANLDICYPEKLLFPENYSFDWTLKEVMTYEQAHGGIADEGLHPDPNTDLIRQNFKVKTDQMQPIVYRSYIFENDAENVPVYSFRVYYPKEIVFHDRGGGIGNFSASFLSHLEKNGFSAPVSSGSAFIAINKEKKLMMIIALEKYNEQEYFSLSLFVNNFT